MRADGQTDRHDEGNSRFSQFCERALKRSADTITAGYEIQSRHPRLTVSPEATSVTKEKNEVIKLTRKR
jgi:hypothetical protein